MRNDKTIKLFFFFCAALLLTATAAQAEVDHCPRQFVEKLLIAEGMDKSQAESIIHDPRISFRPQIVIKNLFHSSPKGSAKKPEVMEISPGQIARARDFIFEHSTSLTEVEKRYGTSPPIIAAILLIESRLGTFPMPYNVATAYANLAFMLDSNYAVAIQTQYAKDYPQINDEATQARVRRKAKWALGELVSLVNIANHLNIDPLTISGSFAGAMGPAQFIPSSFWLFGVDGNGDGIADPNNLTDAKHSMGQYLRKYGWKETASDQAKRKALWHYNRSRVYVNTVMMVYEKLKKPQDN